MYLRNYKLHFKGIKIIKKKELNSTENGFNSLFEDRWGVNFLSRK
jgi:hypothetical protein